MTSISKPPLEGIGGWLAFLAFGQTMSILRLVIGLVRNSQAYGQLAEMPGGHITMLAETAMNLGLIALAMATAFALFQKKRVFKTLFLYQWLAILGATILDVIVVAFALGIPISRAIASVDASPIASFIVAGIWVWYTRKSRRVANTMVN